MDIPLISLGTPGRTGLAKEREAAGERGEGSQESGTLESKRQDFLEGDNAQFHMLKDKRSNKVRTKKGSSREHALVLGQTPACRSLRSGDNELSQLLQKVQEV